MSIKILIPARFNSSRFPGKPLAKILGKEMILRVLNICNKTFEKENIYVATESKNIKDTVSKNGFNVILTSKKCPTGTDRIAEISEILPAAIPLFL